jgi:NitT/TauT family transport system ATP-binding protein
MTRLEPHVPVATEPVPEVPPPGTGSRAPGGSTIAVAIHGVTKVYGHAGNAVPALDHVSLDVQRGEFVCLLGASGCGKSTLLNLVAGIDSPTAGSLDVAGRTTLMFQEAALFPWLTAQGNVELALKLQKMKKTERRRRSHELLRLVHLEGFDRKLPHELSGGMRQRVQLARSLAQGVDVLLMDEPFGALDAMTRDILHDEVERLWQEQRLTILFVTHNVREAVRLGDRVVMLSSRPGRVVEDYRVSIPRPRRIESHEVADQAAEITGRLREEVRRHGD